MMNSPLPSKNTKTPPLAVYDAAFRTYQSEYPAPARQSPPVPNPIYKTRSSNGRLKE